MSGISIGDMAQHFTSMRNGGVIKSELASLSQSLSSGKVEDLTAELEGGTERFSGITYSLQQLGAYQTALRETSQLLSDTQTVLSQLDSLRSTAADRLLRVNDSSTSAQIQEAAQSSQSTFSEMVRTLNTRIGDRALLGGARVDAAPLASADDMMSAIVTAIGGATDAAAIIATVNDWFDSPGGGFDTMGYLGDTGPEMKKQISETGTVSISARADDPAIKDVLKGAVVAGLASALPTLDLETKADLLMTAGQGMFGSSANLIAIQAEVGFAEELVARSMAQNSAQETTLGMARNTISRIDPFETASALQAVQLQLETHFAVTARLSQLSLLRYL